MLKLFDRYTAGWFAEKIGEPTPVQQASWPAIASGSNTLVSAPTGTGKTLSAFLYFIDRMKAEAREGTLKPELQLIYVSPLKSLAGDIRENLRRPLDGIREQELLSGIPAEDISEPSIFIRTGDTTQSERRKMIKTPPNILITTPESLFLLLTSMSGQKILSTAKAVIIDELHALIDSKRGAHLMLTLARIDELAGKPLQRIGLSATIEPLNLAAEYLSLAPVVIAAPHMNKEVRIDVINSRPKIRRASKDAVWQKIALAVVESCKDCRSVIAFTEGRAYAEKLSYYVNQIAGEGFARTHHGSLSKEQRHETEQALRDGRLRLLCATSSMELGIDVGDIDKVLQIGCSRSISGTLQRLGRAGHNPGRVSVMDMYPRSPAEALFCGLTAKVAVNGGIEDIHPPKLCFDVLAQHLVSMATGDGYTIEDAYRIITSTYTFKDVTKEDIHDILCMLAGDYEHEREIPVRPRLIYDRINGQVIGDAYSRMLSISAGGTIPDKGMYAVLNEAGVKLGELDEEYVYEARIGDKFILGSFAWKILSLRRDAVVVTQTGMEGARPPFWKNEWNGRGLKTGLAFGALLRKLGEANVTGELEGELKNLGLDEDCAIYTEDFLTHQFEATTCLPDDRTIVIEHYRASGGDTQMMVHSIFGRRVNAPLALMLQAVAKQKLDYNVGCVDDDNGFMLYLYGNQNLPEGMMYQLKPEAVRPVLEALLPATPIFNMTFRYNAAHALMMGIKKKARNPLWLQRIRSADMLDSLVTHREHPLIRETTRECLNDCWDLEGVEYVLRSIQNGNIEVREMTIDQPSPMSLPLQWQVEAELMYNYAPTTPGIQQAAAEALKSSEKISASKEQLVLAGERKHVPENAQQLHSTLMIEGDLIAGELNIPVEWLEELNMHGRVQYIEPGLWIPAEFESKYLEALTENNNDSMLQIIRRLLAYRGPQDASLVAERYRIDEQRAAVLLAELEAEDEAVSEDGLYYHKRLYERARELTIKDRRRVTTVPGKNYAALCASYTYIAGTPADQLENCIRKLRDHIYPLSFWEGTIFPARVSGYSAALLDSVLSKGDIVWRYNEGMLKFCLREEIDEEMPDKAIDEWTGTLTENEAAVFDMLRKKGACFAKTLAAAVKGITPHDDILSLVRKGLLCSDSLAAVREIENEQKTAKTGIRQRVNSKVLTMTSGRFEIAFPLKPVTIREQLDICFDEVLILSKETINKIPWSAALNELAVMEYTGDVRRGYFVEGLSGAQFIRDADYTAVLSGLANPRTDITWLSALDPAQIWGKALKHHSNSEFINVAGTVTAFCGGLPVMVFERNGQILRCLADGNEDTDYEEVLKQFIISFQKRRIYGSLNRINIHSYPKELEEVLCKAGFMHEMLDYTLYRR